MRALVLGAAGQDGWYLCHHLRELGYDVTGLILYSEAGRQVQLEADLEAHIVLGNVQDPGSMMRVLRTVKPNEVYNLAGEILVQGAWEAPWLFYEVNTHGLLNVLEAIVLLDLDCKVFQASSSDMFGAAAWPQNERTPFNPMNPYAGSKLAAHHLAQQYRRKGVRVSCGILFPHESPRKSVGVVQKICRAVAAIKAGRVLTLTLGNLEATRDWGHAEDTVRAMPLMLQLPADDWVVGTGQGHSVQDVVTTAFAAAGLDAAGRVQVSEDLVRVHDSYTLVADPAKIVGVGWRPRIGFNQMIEELVRCH